MPTIVFETRDSGGNDLSAVKVTMDGEVLAERLEGTAISLDPGSHAFTFESPGQPQVTKQIIIREGEKDRREAIRFDAASSSPTPPSPSLAPPPPEPLPTASASPVAATEPTSSGPGTQKVLAVASAGVGVVGVALGTVFGLQSISRHKDAEAICPGACPTQQGVDLWKGARSAGTLSTIAFVVGGVGLAGGVVLWVTAKPRSAQVGLGPGSIQLRGDW